MALEKTTGDASDNKQDQPQQQAPSKTEPRRRKRRWGKAKKSTAATAAPTTSTASSTTTTATAPVDPKAKVLAMQESIRARLAAAKAAAASSSSSTTTTATNKRPAPVAPPEEQEQQQQQQQQQLQPKPTKRARHYKLDYSVTAPTFRQQTPSSQATAAAAAPSSTKKKINPYLAHLTTQETIETKGSTDAADAADKEAIVDLDDSTDVRLAARPAKSRQRVHQANSLNFVEPGHWQQVAEHKRQLALKAQASGYVSGRKTGHTIHSATMDGASSGGGYYQGTKGLLDDHDDLSALGPRADANPDTQMPLVLEWWDVELLPSKLKKQVAAEESKALNKQSKAQMLEQLMESSPSKDNSKNNNNNKDASTTSSESAALSSHLQELRTACLDQASLTYSKTATLVQHIVPVKPPQAEKGAAAKPQQLQPTLHLTKKELKRQRKLRRQEKQRELQDMQAAGLVPAPQPRLTLKNFIQVLGDQAIQNPSQMEEVVRQQIEARQRAHWERNQANKLTKEQRAEKRARKLQEDTSNGVAVAIFYVKDMSHPYLRTKVDLNAQQCNITGGVLECEHPSSSLACVICEGGPKAMKRFQRLMLVRMKWTGPDEDEDEDEDANDGPPAKQQEPTGQEQDEDDATPRKFNPDNTCRLVWQGMAVKRLFKGFLFQSCETPDQARKVLKAKGVAHYWDQVLEVAKQVERGGDTSLGLRLASSDSDDDVNPYAQNDHDDDDVVMKDADS